MPADAAALPPGPSLSPSEQTAIWARESLAFLEDCGRRYGDSFTLRLQHWGEWVVLSDPEDVKAVFVASARQGVALANPLLGPLLGRRSVMLLEEPEHMVRRKLMLPSFHGPAIEADGERIAAVVREEVARWPSGEPFELWPRMQDITQEVVVRAVFGGGDEGRLDRLRELLRNLTRALNDPELIERLTLQGPDAVVASREYRGAMDPVEGELLEEVRRRRGAGEDDRRDIVSILVRARYEDGEPMGERDLRDELVTLLTDGPTSSSLAWVFERLLRHPDKLARLREEIESGESSAYADATIQETLRICPPVPVVVRKLREPMRLGGRQLPAGTTVAPCIHLVHQRRDVYPDPEVFRPERFLERPPGTYTWIPFGGGVRRCLAASYAELEMKRTLRTVLEQVDLKPVGAGSEAMRKAAISFSPDRSARVIAEPRARSGRRLAGAPA